MLLLPACGRYPDQVCAAFADIAFDRDGKTLVYGAAGLMSGIPAKRGSVVLPGSRVTLRRQP